MSEILNERKDISDVVISTRIRFASGDMTEVSSKNHKLTGNTARVVHIPVTRLTVNC